jgi:hypothetical protein
MTDSHCAIVESSNSNLLKKTAKMIRMNDINNNNSNSIQG